MCTWKNYNGCSQSPISQNNVRILVPCFQNCEMGGEADGGERREGLAWSLKKEMAVLEEGGEGLELVDLVQAE